MTPLAILTWAFVIFAAVWLGTTLWPEFLAGWRRGALPSESGTTPSEPEFFKVGRPTNWAQARYPDGWHEHRAGDHAHKRADQEHRHEPNNAKTYFRGETRSDGMPVKCEGHYSVELDVTDDWAYPKGAFA